MTEVRENSVDKNLDTDCYQGPEIENLDNCVSHLFPRSFSSGGVVDLRHYVIPSRIIAEMCVAV